MGDLKIERGLGANNLPDLILNHLKAGPQACVPLYDCLEGIFQGRCIERAL
jgi:hypothetical protein